MSDSLEELIREIAVVNGVAVDKNDPIMILHTINARLLNDSARAQQTMLDSYKAELEAIAFRWGNDAKEKAERILSASLTVSRDAMAQSMAETATETAKAVRAEVEDAIRLAQGPINESKAAARLALIAACMAFAAAVLAFFAGR